MSPIRLLGNIGCAPVIRFRECLGPQTSTRKKKRQIGTRCDKISSQPKFATPPTSSRGKIGVTKTRGRGANPEIDAATFEFSRLSNIDIKRAKNSRERKKCLRNVFISGGSALIYHGQRVRYGELLFQSNGLICQMKLPLCSHVYTILLVAVYRKRDRIFETRYSIFAYRDICRTLIRPNKKAGPRDFVNRFDIWRRKIFYTPRWLSRANREFRTMNRERSIGMGTVMHEHVYTQTWKLKPLWLVFHCGCFRPVGVESENGRGISKRFSLEGEESSNFSEFSRACPGWHVSEHTKVLRKRPHFPV